MGNKIAHDNGQNPSHSKKWHHGFLSILGKGYEKDLFFEVTIDYKKHRFLLFLCLYDRIKMTYISI